MKFKINSCCTISIHKEGLTFVAILFGLSVVSLAASGLHTLTLLLIIFTSLVMWFFRDPDRVTPRIEKAVIAPADGKIVSITKTTLPPELDDKSAELYHKISIFLNVTDVHVQRMPVKGKVSKIEYVPGAFVNASFDKASTDNERNIILLESFGINIAVVQIAGFVARRIVSNAKIGDEFEVGQRYGIIKFGSRVDLYLPLSYKLNILEGQMMVGGETLITTL
jgi:phosphatidylserine decarboxylase